MSIEKLVINNKEEKFSDFTRSETKYRKIGDKTFVYFVVEYKSGPTKVVVPGIVKSEPYEISSGVNVINMERVNCKDSSLKPKIEECLKKEGDEIIIWPEMIKEFKEELTRHI